MRIFTIENGNNRIEVHASVQEASVVADAKRFRNQAELTRLTAGWPASRLVDTWNGLRGVKHVNRFRDRSTGVSRIWNMIQNLKHPVIGLIVQGSTTVNGTRERDSTQNLEIEPNTSGTRVSPQMPGVTTVSTSGTKTRMRTPVAPGPREGSKAGQVIAMLKRKDGTTVEEIMSATGWQKHTVRAMLSAGGSLAKKHGIVTASREVANHRRYYVKFKK